MLAKDTITAEMAFMFMERNSGTSTIDYPLGGSRAIVDALVRGLQRYGGRLLLRSHVDHILMEGAARCSVPPGPWSRGALCSGGRWWMSERWFVGEMWVVEVGVVLSGWWCVRWWCVVSGWWGLEYGWI